MPIYEYQCESCDRVIEKIQRFSDDPIRVCEDCGGPTRKLISQSSFHLKGSGWYVTDYANKGEGKDKGKDKDKGKAEAKETPSSGSSESKPTTKPEAGSSSSSSTPASSSS